MLRDFRASASRRLSSSTFFARRVNGMCPFTSRPLSGLGVSSAPGPKAASTLSRTASRSIPTVPSAAASSCSWPVNRWRTATADLWVNPCRANAAAVGEPSWSSRPRSRCSVPMKLWCSRLASSWDETTTCRASSVKRSNIAPAPSPERPTAARVFLVHRLPGDAEPLGDLLPRPALVARVLHLEGLQPLDERAQGTHGRQAHRGIPAAGGRCHFCCVRHACQLKLPNGACQLWLTRQGTTGLTWALASRGVARLLDDHGLQ